MSQPWPWRHHNFDGQQSPGGEEISDGIGHSFVFAFRLEAREAILGFHSQLMERYRIVFIGVLFVLISISLKILLFDLIGVNFESQGTYISHSLRVSLGYATYEGFADAGSGINTWLGSVPLCL